MTHGSHHVPKRRRWSARAAVALVGAALAVGAAQAAPTGDRAVAEQAIAAVQRNPADAALGSDALKQAKAALARAHDMHAAGDHAHAALLERVAREWAEMASDVVRAAKVERHASELEVDANDAEQKALRAQALIEETLARRNRAKERLEQMKTEAKPPPPEKTPAPSGKSPPPPKADKTPPPKADKPAPAGSGSPP